MKTISENIFNSNFEKQLIYALFNLRKDVLEYYYECYNKSKNDFERNIVNIFIKNNEFAKNEFRSLCQDSGYIQIFIEKGYNVFIDFNIEESVSRIVEKIYKSYYLRMSINDPISRKNTNKNTPVFIDYELLNGDLLSVYIVIKGGGSENSTKSDFLLPTCTLNDIYKWVENNVKNLGSKACPPYYIGVAIGGNLEKALYWSKKILIKEINKDYGNNEEMEIAFELKKRINNLNIGFFGLKIFDTVIDVKVKIIPCHIATLPIAMTVQCNSVRQGQFVL